MKFFFSACAALLMATTTAAPTDHQQRELQIVGVSSVARELLAAVNAARATNGSPPLCLNAKLSTASQLQAVDMAAGGFISATGSTGSTPTSRAIDQKFNTTGVAELVGAGYTNAKNAITEWMASPDYNMYLLGDYKYFGAGYAFNAAQTYKTFWVVDFDKSAVGESCV